MVRHRCHGRGAMRERRRLWQPALFGDGVGRDDGNLAFPCYDSVSMPHIAMGILKYGHCLMARGIICGTRTCYEQEGIYTD